MQPYSWIDLSDYLENRRIFARSLDDTGRLLLLTVAGEKSHHPVESRTYIIIEATENNVTEYTIPNCPDLLQFVQMLPDDELLLVNSLSYRRAEDDYDLNASVFSRDGTLKRQMLLGDSLEHVQTTADGHIWTGYRDQGIFGNRGWGMHPVGRPGLIQWDVQGNITYKYQPSAGLKHIADCYALNVVSDDAVFVYYYTQFPLVKLNSSGVLDYWQAPIHYSRHFAVWRNQVVFCGTHDDNFLRRYALNDNHEMELLSRHRVIERDDVIITRGRYIVIQRGHMVYRIDLAQALQ
jgi:hypothetical protein